VRTALLVEAYRRLPEREEVESPEAWAGRVRDGLGRFKREVATRYTEATLQRLLTFASREVRRASVLALGMVGTFSSNKPLAARLHDNDPEVRQLAADGLWAVWFRGDLEAHAKELQRIMRQRDPKKALDALDGLLKKAPNFAEAHNQRAILYFRLEDYARSVADCEAALKLNPYHFGAQAGMAQCYMKMRKPRAALKAFRNAFRINPNLEGVEDTIRTLEDVLGEEGRKEDK
jgi:tetratricopeptide (TPR) repeat protein